MHNDEPDAPQARTPSTTQLRPESLSRSQGLTILMVTHDLSTASYTRRVVFITAAGCSPRS